MNADNPMARQRGVTLIELMVTLAIVAIVVFAVLPDIGSWMRNTQIRNAAESIEAGLQRARNEAVHRNRTVQFTLVSLTDPANIDNSCAPSSTAASWVISLADPTGNCGAANNVTPFVVDSHAMADGSSTVSVSAVQADGATAASSVTFDGLGRIVSAAPIASIDVTHASAGTRPLRIVLTASGSIRTCDPNMGDATDPRHC